jgi:hypothetical protein
MEPSVAGTTVGATIGSSNWPKPDGRPSDYFPDRDIPPGLFEIGLVMGGTVSAGAYTAGVMDFLFEALDAWEDARNGKIEGVETARVPSHRVRIRIMTGTSGGGINALLAARALHYRFPHAVMRSAESAGENLSNPFYDVWVNDVDITDLLDNSDLRPGMPINSILNGNVLQKVAHSAVNYPSAAQAQNVVESRSRSWVYNPMSIVVTHTNLTGVPYAQDFTGLGLSQEYFANHADYVQLYAGFSPSPHSPSPGARYLPQVSYLNVPAGFALPSSEVPPELVPIRWQELVQNALGTAAYVVGFPARTVKRDAVHYAYRFVMNNESGQYDWITPMWSGIAQSDAELSSYSFTSLDGGFTNNEPILFASQAIEGLGKNSAREASHAQCAIVLIDPLSHPLHSPKNAASVALAKILAPTVQMFFGASRFGTADMAGFLSADVYNRFLIAPKRTLVDGTLQVGGDALCSDGFGAFLGFMSRDFREHDFMLGRRNCQAFLTGTLVLSRDNKVFVDHRPETPQWYSDSKPSDSVDKCPVVPLYGSAALEQPQPVWPAGKFEPDTVSKPIRRRAYLMLKRANRFLGLPMLGRAAFNCLAARVLAPKTAKKIVSMIRAELERKGLT